MTDIHDEVRDRYADAARMVRDRGVRAEDSSECCGGSGASCCGEQTTFGPELYGRIDLRSVPDTAILASLGCGNPTAVAELREGETVLDLGSGGGIDVLLSASRVGTNGKVYGLDMTDEMLALALENKAKAGVENVEFLKGYIESIPLPGDTIDVVISNCVINLSADKPSVFAEMFRVLRPGGRIGITDVVAANELTAEQRSERGSYVGCIAGALSFEEYEAGLTRAGFEAISVTATHEVAASMHSAIVKARKPLTVQLPVLTAFSHDSECC
jgi:arsenite methyltransferase